MELKSLYNEWESSTTEGHELYSEVSRALEPIMQRMEEKGFRLREVAHVMHSAIGELEAVHCLTRNMAAYKKGDRPKE